MELYFVSAGARLVVQMTLSHQDYLAIIHKIAAAPDLRCLNIL